jgi:hypothetical protein
VLTKSGDTNTEPAFTTILITNIELNANAASGYSERGDRLLGHLALTINAIYYVSHSKGDVGFNAPFNSPSVPVHKDKATEADIAKENPQHKAHRLELVLWKNVNTVLRNLLVAAVPGIFIAANKNPVTGFINVTCLKLLTHLYDTYGQITEKSWRKT